MIVAFSTSSAVASVALISLDGEVLEADQRPADQRASGACLEMLDRLLAIKALRLQDATLFAADFGPGSFTGVRVGVTLAKTFAFVHGVKAAGASAFDLISPDDAVGFPSRKGEFFVRYVGQAAMRVTELPPIKLRGFGLPEQENEWPLASAFSKILDKLQSMDPIDLTPRYLIEPSISQPKKPFTAMGASGG